MRVFILVFSAFIGLVLGVKSIATIRKWVGSVPQPEGQNPDVQILKYCGVGSVCFLAAMILALCTLSPMILGQTSVFTQHLAQAIIIAALSGLAWCMLDAWDPLFGAVTLGISALIKKIRRR